MRVGVVLTFLLSSIFSHNFSFSLGTAPYRLKCCLKGPLNPKQTNKQSFSSFFRLSSSLNLVFFVFSHSVFSRRKAKNDEKTPGEKTTKRRKVKERKDERMPREKTTKFTFQIASCHMAFFRLCALKCCLFASRVSSFRLFAWRYFVFSHGVFSSYRIASFHFVVFSPGVFSPRQDKTRNGTIQPP